MNRTSFIIDGFNVYHSLIQAERDSLTPTKWLDLHKLCRSFLPIIGRSFGSRAELEDIFYYSASPIHRKSDKVNRHSLYMKCLEVSGVEVYLGRFKKKTVFCRKCRRKFIAHEEKESDVAIAMKLFETLYADECDTAVLVTGDTDLSPAVKTCKRLFPSKNILFAFPYKRRNNELAKLSSKSFSIKQNSYTSCQFSNPLIDSDGNRYNKPNHW